MSETTDLSPFSENARCPKCGDYLVRSTWMDAAPSAPERVLRHCTCGYSWLEAPLDAAPAEILETDNPESQRADRGPLADDPGVVVLQITVSSPGSDAQTFTHVVPLAPLDATNADDEPEDAYLDAKLAAQTPPDAQKPASAARQAETGIRDHIDRHDAAESNFERLTTCAREAPSERERRTDDEPHSAGDAAGAVPQAWGGAGRG